MVNPAATALSSQGDAAQLQLRADAVRKKNRRRRPWRAFHVHRAEVSSSSRWFAHLEVELAWRTHVVEHHVVVLGRPPARRR